MNPDRFHFDCLVVDGHTDVPSRLYHAPADLGERLGDRHIDLPRLRQGGVDAFVAALFVPSRLDPEAGWRHALELHGLLLARLRPGELELAASVEEIRRAADHGVVAVVLGLENGRPLSDPEVLRTCARMGVRYVTLTHEASHEWCDASTDDPVHGGLEPDLGVRLVREMGRLGILPDISHASDDAAWQVLEVARGPVVASHSSARALCDHPRNLPDELVRQVARRGGVVMANAYAAFLDPEAARINTERTSELVPLLRQTESWDRDTVAAFAAERRRLLAEHPLPPVPLSTYVDHLIHLVELVGEEHVGVGTDFDGVDATPEGLADVSEMPHLTAALLARGIDRAGVRLILGENFLRLLAEAERRAGP